MGLDQYAYVTDFKPNMPVDFTLPGEDTYAEDTNVLQRYNTYRIQYWRKHPNLQGWMEELYYRKGGQATDFNCVNVQINEKDLDELERAVNNNLLPQTRGFFFGESRPEDADLDREFITSARAALREGKTVYYTSWW